MAMRSSHFTHRKCLSLIGPSPPDWPADSFQLNGTSDISTKNVSQDLPQRRHVRNHSDVLFPGTCSVSTITPAELRGSQGQSRELVRQVAELESDNFRLHVELEAAKRKNEELQEVLSAYDNKIAALLTRTTDCMGRVIKTKNSEISRLETCLHSKTDQFAAKLEAEAQKSKELQSASSFASMKRLEKLLSQTRDANSHLSEEVARLKVRVDLAETEAGRCRRREEAHQQQSKILEELSKQLEEVEERQEALQRENAALKASEQQAKTPAPEISPQQDLEVRQLCHMINSLRDLLEACRQGNLTQVLKGPGTTTETLHTELIQAKANLSYIETQLLSWYSTLCGNECHIS